MPDKPDKKKFTERLRDVFRRKARPKVPDDIVNNKAVQKAVFKNRRRKRWRQLRNLAIASTALSTVLQFAPDVVSTPYGDYMAARGYDAQMQEHFHARDIRVYDRNNPLYPFHHAGHMTAMGWSELDRAGYGFLSKAFVSPFIYGSSLFNGTMKLVFSSPLDAHAISGSAPVEDRGVFIRPPSEFTVMEFLAEFSGYHASSLQFRHEDQDLARVLYQYVMLHEARHGDQDKSVSTTLNETDADRYAFEVLAARGTEPGLLAEAREIVMHGRTLASVSGGGTSHATSLALMRSYPTAFDAYEDGAAFRRLHNILADAAHMNSEAFPGDMPLANRFIYIAGALNANRTLHHDAELRAANAHFIAAVNFFQEASGYKLYNPFFNFSAIDVDYLKESYKPVPDKLATDQAMRPPAAGPRRPGA